MVFGAMTRASGRVVRMLAALALVAAAELGGPGDAFAQLGALVSPGRLSTAHRALEGVGNCLQCHSKGQQVAAEKCLTCHKPVAERIAAKTGVHRGVTTDCVSCHVEHAGRDADLRHFDQSRFDHTRDTGFPLLGLHAPLVAKCAACHTTRSFLAAGTTCASCHADPHKGSLGTGCATCHSTSAAFSVTGRAFDHQRSRFPLAGAHAKVGCESCHVKGQWKGLAFTSCASCHADPHQTRMGAACASCHTESSWRTARVEHARTAFPLKGKHALVACRSCHVKPAMQVKPRADTCAACHQDPHNGTFKQDCSACHTESGFAKGAFDHSATKFALTGKHAELACSTCHKGSAKAPSDFRGLSTTCSSCHADVHGGELGSACERCHTPASFAVSVFSHSKQRPFFEGRHAGLTCAQCHLKPAPPTRAVANAAARVGFTTTASACASCHRDPHLGQLALTCEKCHSVDAPKFAAVGFSHAATIFPLTGKHAPLQCEQCHAVETGAFPAGAGTARRFTGIGTACAACHQDPHRGQLGASCAGCHAPDSFVVSKYTHKNAKALREFFAGRHNAAACAACHKPLPQPGPGIAPAANYKVTTACVACHVDVHRGALGPNCAVCHKP